MALQAAADKVGVNVHATKRATRIAHSRTDGRHQRTDTTTIAVAICCERRE
jgi:hypothetical protein